MDRIILEGTLTKVTSSRAQKAELTLGKVEMCWQIRDPEQVGLLTMLQNGIVRITIENPQMDMFHKQAEAEDPQESFDFESAEGIDVIPSGHKNDGVRYLPGHEDEDAGDPFESTEITSEELGEEFKNQGQ